MDQMFFQEAGIQDEEFKNLVATGASDEEVEEWLKDMQGELFLAEKVPALGRFELAALSRARPRIG